MNRKSLALVIVLSAAILPYLNCLENDFVWDDRPLIVQNYQIKNVKYLWRLFSRDFFDHVDEEIKYGYYRPLVSLSYMLDYRVWGDDPSGYHITNIILHAVNSVLVMMLVARLFKGRPGVALASALIFAVHPMHTESVAWIAGRTDLIATLFMLGSLLAFDSYCCRGRGGGIPAVSLTLFICALLAKETAVVFPAIVGAYLLLFRGDWKAERRWGLIGAYAAVTVGYMFIRFGLASIKAGPPSTLTPQQIILSFCSTFLLYVYKMLFPVNFSAYITNPVAESPFDPRAVGGAALLLAFVTAGALAWRRNRPLAFFIVFAVISFIPLANIVRISSPDDMGFPAAERLLYMPSIGLIVVAAAAVGLLIRRRAVATGLAAAVVVVFAALTMMRNTVWRDEEALITDALSSSPEAPLLWNNLGVHYSRIGRHGEAVQCLQKAIFLEGATPRFLNNLATVKRRMGNLDESLELLSKALVEGEPLSQIYFNLGMTYVEMGESERAIVELKKAVGLNPEHIESLVELAEIQKRMGRYELAEIFYLRALEIHPRSASIWSNLGVVYKLWWRLDDAAEAFRRSIAIDGRSSTSRSNLGVVMAKMGRYNEALGELETARSLEPGNLDAANAMGVLLVRTGMEREAEDLFRGLVREYPADKEAYINMGILKYGQGMEEDAALWFKRALEVSPENRRAMSYLEQITVRSQREEKIDFHLLD